MPFSVTTLVRRPRLSSLLVTPRMLVFTLLVVMVSALRTVKEFGAAMLISLWTRRTLGMALTIDSERLRNIWLRNPDFYSVDTPVVNADLPDFNLNNTQVGVRVQWLVGLFDMSVSYYRGRDCIPVSKASYSTAYSSGMVSENGTPIPGVGTDVRLSSSRLSTG